MSPVSSYRWHRFVNTSVLEIAHLRASMSEEEFTAYRERLEKEVHDYMEFAEAKEGEYL